MARRIVVTSGKGGVGKTTVTASLGIGIACMGHKVLLIDGDVGLNNLDVVLGIENRVVYDMADVLEGKCRVNQALIEYEYVQNLSVMPSAHAYGSEDIGAKNFRQLINRLDNSFDYILIDCPAGIEAGFHRAVSAASEAILVTTPNVSAIRDADKVLTLLSSYELNDVNIVINRMRGDLVLSGEMMSAGDISRLLRYPPIGIIPEDDNVAIYSQLGKLGLQQSSSKIACEFICDNIVSGRRRLYDCTSQYRGLFGRIKMLFRRDA